MNYNELNLNCDVLFEVESVKNNYEKIMSFVETKNPNSKKEVIEYSNSLQFLDYKIFRDAISNMGKQSSGKKKFAFYELSAAIMNNRSTGISLIS